ncbi:MAG: site-2 protease family protein [Fimbriimonadia bacterium]|nr:site-2 protease family protein [Fimbriimonadia bacterium]
MPEQSPELLILRLIAVFLSIGIHEFAHAKSADMAGDPTPRVQGRVTLNPIAHLDPVGSILIFITALSGYGIGWGKPVQVNPANFKNPRQDSILVAAWGPLSNIVLAVIFSILLKTTAQALPTMVVYFMVYMVIVNIWLALFNLIPLHPLDGSKIVGGLITDMYRERRYWNFQMVYGPMLLFGSILILPLIGIHVLSMTLAPIANMIFDALL